jgi:DNA-binding winged helix-turn-helix (wHTH) protein
MQDVPQERSEADAPPSGEAMAPVCFAGLVFDLSACTLARESGEAIALTRGEFRLLRLFVSRPGRVLSRDAILEAVANRPLELFDRSADALVGRLRRKIEPDPKAPRLIATVAGEGYRFDGLAPALRGALVDGAAESHPQVAAETAAETAPGARPADYPEPSAAPFPNSAASAPPRSWRRPAAAAALVAALLGVGAYAWRPELPTRFMGTGAEDKLANAPRLSIVVLPFENLSGDKEQDYFADGITDDLTTDLSHLQDSFVISRGTAFTYKGKPVDAKAIGKELGVRYCSKAASAAPARKWRSTRNSSRPRPAPMSGPTGSRASAASSAGCRSISSPASPTRSESSSSRPKPCAPRASGRTIPTRSTSRCKPRSNITFLKAGRL